MAETEEECGLEAPRWAACLERRGREELERYGRILDQRRKSLHGNTAGVVLAERLLIVRTREGKPAQLKANAAQRAFERRRGNGTLC